MAVDTIKPGRVVSLTEFTDSMAEAMDKAFKQEWQAVKGTAISSLGEKDRRILLVAIAQGITAHLQQHIEAIQVEVTISAGDGEGTAVALNVEGLMGGLTS